MKVDRPPSSTYHAVTHVWGRDYLDVFLNICIPNQLAPGNIPALPQGSRYRILTQSAHVPELDAHPNVNALRRAIPVDIIVVDALDRKGGVADGHDLMIACHRRAIEDILANDAAIIMLSADFVFSDNAMAAIVRRHREGYRAVVNTGLRLAKESFLEHLRESRAPLDALSPRELVRMAWPHLHPHTESMFADARSFSTFPVGVCWRVGDAGMLARFMHLHPLMVDPMSRAALKGTNDGRYVFRVVPDFSKVHVVTDSDELQMFELTTAKRPVIASRGEGASAMRAAAVASMCDGHQVGYWKTYKICVHANGLGAEWDAAAAASDRFVARTMRWYPHGQSLRRWFWLIERARQRRDRYRRVWRRYKPEVSLKQVLRPVRVATHRSTKTLRKTTKQIWRRVTAH
jgi:hypothetical protein